MHGPRLISAFVPFALFVATIAPLSHSATYSCRYLDTPMTMDGSMSDWNFDLFASDQKVIINKHTASYVAEEWNNIPSAQWPDTNDMTMTTYLAYNDDRFLFACIRRDDRLVCDIASSSTNLFDMYMNDCIEVWMDGNFDRNTNMIDNNQKYDAEIDVDFSGYYSVYRNPSKGESWYAVPPALNVLTGVSELGGNLYFLEFSIPFASLYISPGPGDKVGVSLAAIDDDATVSQQNSYDEITHFKSIPDLNKCSSFDTMEFGPLMGIAPGVTVASPNRMLQRTDVLLAGGTQIRFVQTQSQRFDVLGKRVLQLYPSAR